MSSMLAFTTILGTCTAGILQMSWWACVAGTCMLALVSMSNHAVAFRTLGGGASAPTILVMSSLVNASITSAAALAIGRLIGWVWGV